MHIDENGKKSTSIQMIADNGVWCEWFTYEQFSGKGNKPQVEIGENVFFEQGLKLNIKTEKITAFGSLEFGPLTPIRYDIMGPFRYVSFMECRHSVVSMTHTVKDCLNIITVKNIGLIAMTAILRVTEVGRSRRYMHGCNAIFLRKLQTVLCCLELIFLLAQFILQE